MKWKNIFTIRTLFYVYIAIYVTSPNERGFVLHKRPGLCFYMYFSGIEIIETRMSTVIAGTCRQTEKIHIWKDYCVTW